MHLLDRCEVVLSQPFVADGSVVAFYISVLLRLAGLNVVKCNAMILRPLTKCVADVFRPIVHPNGIGAAAPFDDPVKRTNDACRWQREVNLNAKAFAVEVIQHIKLAEGSGVFKAVGHEVHRPHGIGLTRHSQFFRLLPDKSFSWFYSHVQFQIAINSVHALVVPGVVFDVAQI